MNRFLSLTLSLMMTVTPLSLALRPGPRALVRSFPLVRLPWLVAGDGQESSLDRVRGEKYETPDLSEVAEVTRDKKRHH